MNKTWACKALVWNFFCFWLCIQGQLLLFLLSIQYTLSIFFIQMSGVVSNICPFYYYCEQYRYFTLNKIWIYGVLESIWFFILYKSVSKQFFDDLCYVRRENRDLHVVFIIGMFIYSKNYRSLLCLLEKYSWVF